MGPTEKGLLNRVAPWLVSNVSRNMFGHLAALRLLERGFIAQPTGHQWNVLRIEPPLTISAAEIDSAAQAIGAVLADYQSLATLIKDTTVRIGQQFSSGWAID